MSVINETQMVEAARRLRDKGIGIVWIRPGDKRPKRKAWTKSSDEPEGYEPGSNLGIQTGGLSEMHGGYLVCLDLDKPQVLELADQHLPPTGMLDGRKSKPCSHRYYVVTDVPDDMVSTAGVKRGPASKDLRGPDKKNLIEFKATGRQVVAPPSLHPEGEIREWQAPDGSPLNAPGEPTVLPFNELWDAVSRLHEACGGQPRTSKQSARPAKTTTTTPPSGTLTPDTADLDALNKVTASTKRFSGYSV